MISNFFLRTFAFRDLCRLHRYLSDAPVAAEASKLPLAQQKRFKDIERLLQVHKLEDWYKIRSRDVVKAGGTVVGILLPLSHFRLGGYMLMNLHRGSLPSLVVEMHPNHRWESWRWPAARGRTSLPASAEEIRAYLQSLKPVATSQDMTEFLYALTPEWLKCQPGGLWLMRQIPKNESLSGVVGVAFPEFDWKPELFAWSGGADKVAAVKRLASRLGISQLSGWYDIDPSVIQKDPEGAYSSLALLCVLTPNCCQARHSLECLRDHCRLSLHLPTQHIIGSLGGSAGCLQGSGTTVKIKPNTLPILLKCSR